MKRKWDNLKNQNGHNNKKRPFRFGFIVLFFFTVISCILPVESIFSDAGYITSNGRKIVSKEDNAYLEKVDYISELNAILKENIVKDLNENGYADYKKHANEVEKIIDEINILLDMKINETSDLKPYSITCSNYYGEHHRFYINFKYEEVITVDSYNNLLDSLKYLKDPYEHIIELFELYGYDFTVSDNILSYKYVQ